MVVGCVFLCSKPRSIVGMICQIVVRYVFLCLKPRSLIGMICQMVVGYVVLFAKFRNLIRMTHQIVVGYAFTIKTLKPRWNDIPNCCKVCVFTHKTSKQSPQKSNSEWLPKPGRFLDQNLSIFVSRGAFVKNCAF